MFAWATYVLMVTIDGRSFRSGLNILKLWLLICGSVCNFFNEQKAL